MSESTEQESPEEVQPITMTLRQATKLRNKIEQHIHTTARSLNDSVSIQVNVLHDLNMAEVMYEANDTFNWTFARYSALTHILYQLRSVIASQNFSANIPHLLTERSAYEVRLRQVKSLLGTIPEEYTSVGNVEREIAHARDTSTASASWDGYSAQVVHICPITPETRENLAKLEGALSASIEVIQDRLEHLNNAGTIILTAEDVTFLRIEGLI